MHVLATYRGENMVDKRPSQSIKMTVKKRCMVEDSLGVFATTDG